MATWIVRATTRSTNGGPYLETWRCEGETAEEAAQGVIDRFNATLRPYETARELVEFSGELAPLEHDWDKTNLTTIYRKGRLYDTYKCQRCGITGKRYGLDEITRDGRYEGERYRHCRPPSP